MKGASGSASWAKLDWLVMRSARAVGALLVIGLVGCSGAAPRSPAKGADGSFSAGEGTKAPQGSSAQAVLDLGTIHPARKAPPIVNQPALGKPTPPTTTPHMDSLPDDDHANHAAATGKPGPKPAPPGAAETMSDSGELTAEQVDSAISDQFDGFARCSAAESVVAVRATVGPDGRVLDVSAGRSTPDDAHLRDCVVIAFRSLQFPKTQAAWPTRLAFDLRLTPQ